jgi:hypothetical protein
MVQPSRGAAPMKIDVTAAVCIVLIACGWFLMSTLVFTIGGLSQPTHFYQLAAIIEQPSMLLMGVDGHEPAIVLFSLLCWSALVVALLVPQRRNDWAAWFAGLAPLVLMLLALLALYRATGAAAPTPPGRGLRADLLRLGNDAMLGVSGKVAQHIHLGAGGVLALLASVVLAYHSVRRYWRNSPLPVPDDRLSQPTGGADEGR